MFLEHFGLRQDPFGMTPDPAYLYASRTHGEALAALSRGIEDTRGFLALVAEPGMGKTTLLYQLSEQLRDTTRVVLLSQTQCNSREFIEYILQELGVDVNGMGLVRMHGQLNEILFEELLAGKRFVLIVDEAQNLDDSVLEALRMLSNFETHNAKLLQIVLAGQPQLAAKLAQPRLSQLRQRIAILSRLEPLSAEEAELYIQHRLKVAGHSGEPIFHPASMALIARESRGIPRNINNLCYNSLRLAFDRGLRSVSADVAREAVASLDMQALAPESRRIPDRLPPAPHASSPAPAIDAPPVTAPNPVGHALPADKIRASNSFLTYAPARKSSVPRWGVRSAIVAVILLSGTLLIAILGRSESISGLRPRLFANFSGRLGLAPRDAHAGATMADYDAAPQDTEAGQVLTVVAGSHQTLSDLCLRYVGHYDSDLAQRIFALNPDLEDPGHLDAGQLIRIPLPPAAMRKANDTEDGVTKSEP